MNADEIDSIAKEIISDVHFGHQWSANVLIKKLAIECRIAGLVEARDIAKKEHLEGFGQPSDKRHGMDVSYDGAVSDCVKAIESAIAAKTTV